MNLDKHIGSLLFEHDCVIVPDFGGFVANYKPASVNPVQHSFTAPSKELVFNRNLRNNDGLLANHIASTDNVDYTRAMGVIRECVVRYTKELQDGKRLMLSGIGVLFLDKEQNLQFEPDGSVNYLTDSFGFSPLLSPSIKREGAVQRIEKQFKDREPVPQTVEKKKQRKYGVYVAAALVPLLALTIYISMQNGTGKIDFSNLNPFSTKTVTPTGFDSAQPPVAILDHNKTSPITVNEQPSGENNNSTSTPNNTITEVAPPVNTTPEVINDQTPVNNTPPVSTYVNTKENDIDQIEITTQQFIPAGFHLVLGCFEKKSNAVRFAKKLRKENVSANIIGKNARGLYVISCGSYTSRAQAEQQKAIVKQTQPSVWLLAN